MKVRPPFLLLIPCSLVFLCVAANAQGFRLDRVEAPASAYKTVDRDSYSFSVPVNWYENPWGDYTAITPRGAYFRGGDVTNMTHGINFGVVGLQNDLEDTLRALVDRTFEANPHLEEQDTFQSTVIADRQALVSTSSGNYPFTGLVEINVVYAVVMPTNQVFHLSTVVPRNDYARYQPVFERIIKSVRFKTKSSVSQIDDRNWRVVLDAREMWFDTGIAVIDGTTVSVSAGGTVVWDPDASASTSTPAGVSYKPMDLSDSSGFPSRSARCGSLVMRIGDSVFNVGSGSNIKIRNIEDGETIEFMINDRLSGLSDNSGTFGIRVSLSAPLSADSQAVTTTGYIDVLEEMQNGCRIGIIAGEKTYSGQATYARLSELTGQRIVGYADALRILNGRRATITITGLSSSPGNSMTFGNIARMKIAAEDDPARTRQTLNQRQTDEELIVDLSTDILFDFDSSTIKPDAVPSLIRLARLIRESKSGRIQLNGFTDSIGSYEYNLGLSARRAASVKQWLVTKGGVDARRLQTKGFGENQPIAPNTNDDGSDNPLGRQKNRRVEIRIPRN